MAGQRDLQTAEWRGDGKTRMLGIGEGYGRVQWETGGGGRTMRKDAGIGNLMLALAMRSKSRL